MSKILKFIHLSLDERKLYSHPSIAQAIVKRTSNYSLKHTSKRMVIVAVLFAFVFGLNVGEANASCSREKHTYANVYHKEADSSFINGNYTDAAQQEAQKKIKELEKKLDNYVYGVCLGIDTGWLGKITSVNPSTIARYLEEHNDKEHGEDSFNALQEQYVEAMKILNPQKKEELSENHCSKANPQGCGKGEKCWRVTYVSGSASINGGGSTDTDITYACAKKNPCGTFSGCRAQEATAEDKKEEEHAHGGAGDVSAATLHNDGSADYYHANFAKNVYNGDYFGYEHLHVNEDGIMTYEEKSLFDAPARTNKDCDIEADRQSYLGTCYSCIIVSAIIRTFLVAVNISMPLMQEAGATLLGLGMLLWIAFYVLQKLSSFVSLEPMKMLQDLFAFFFKCAIAIILITSGIKMIASLIVNPILSAGAEYGIAFIDTVMPQNVSVDGVTSQDSKIYQTVPGEILDKKVFEKIMEVSKKADAAVSINFVIGNAVMCHSTHAGAIVVAKKIQEIVGIEFYFPDVWLWICGAAIWVFAFMVVMGVNFYLLDLSFKIGFALLAMPFTLGLWPFNKFKDKFTECLKMVVNAAGTFMFLGITTGMSIVLISAALGGTDELFAAIKNDNKVYISEKFGFTSGAFLLIIFAYAYSYNLISATVSKMVDKFFGSSISGAVGSPIHHGTTGAINTAKELTMTAGGRVAGWAKKGGQSLAQSIKKAASK